MFLLFLGRELGVCYLSTSLFLMFEGLPSLVQTNRILSYESRLGLRTVCYPEFSTNNLFYTFLNTTLRPCYIRPPSLHPLSSHPVLSFSPFQTVDDILQFVLTSFPSVKSFVTLVSTLCSTQVSCV